MSTIRTQLTKPWVVMPVVVALCFGGWFFFIRKDPSASTTSTATAPRTVAASLGTLARTVTADGTVAAANTDDLSFTSAGTVTAVNVKAGDTVKKGQVLATIDSASLRAAVSSAESNVADAQATLSDDTAAGASDAQLTADESSLTTAQDSLANAQTALAGAQLVATFDGTVASVAITKGDQLGSGGSGGTAQTGSNSGSGRTAGNLGSASSGLGNNNSSSSTSSASTAQIEVVSAGKFTVDLGLDATDVANVKVGQVASVTVSTATSTRGGFGGFGGLRAALGLGNAGGSGNTAATTTTTIPIATTGGATGLVTEVGTVADASSGVASYPVTVAFADTSGTYHVGANVTVAITYAEVKDAVEIPSFAVSTATDGTTTVTVLANGKQSTRTITTGLTSGAFVQVTSGLKVGEQVVLNLPNFGGNGTRTRTGAGGTGAGTGGGFGGGGFGPPGGTGGGG